jgi:hypothetical protein
VIRRGFWLAAGAVTGIYGYRSVSAVGRRLSASLNSAELTQGARLARQGRRTAVSVTRETFRFTRDVREGMELYMARHSVPAGSTLGAREAREARGALGPEPARDLAVNDNTNHDPRPKDGR